MTGGAEADRRLSEIRHALDQRALAWFGTRGTDALPLFDLIRPSIVVSQIAPIAQELCGGIYQDCLETRSRLRRDLDTYDIDLDISQEAAGLKAEFFRRAEGPMVLAAYRAAEMMATPIFCNSELLLASNFHLMQRQFEHKPWVERELGKLDPPVPVLASEFIRDNDLAGLRRLLATYGPMVGRTSTGAGGAGVFVFTSEDEFVKLLPDHFDGFVGVAPLVDRATPLNVNACVYKSGEIATFGVSYQLIGIKGLTRRQMGFCGNDFAAAAGLAPANLKEIQSIAVRVGKWLAGLGYCGIFGLDLLLDNGGPLVSEINPRFQASTPLSAQINRAMGLPDPMSEHIAAFLGLDAPLLPDVVEQCHGAARCEADVPKAQVIHRNLMPANVRVTNPDTQLPVHRGGSWIASLPSSNIYVQHEAMLFKSFHTTQITKDGYSVLSTVRETAATVQTAF
jgi:hypothetical protein